MKAEGPVAARGWAEAVENILWRGFANVLRLGFATTEHQERAQAFLQALLERAPDGHRFADAFHLRGERGVGLWKMVAARKHLEDEAWNLADEFCGPASLEQRL